MQGSGFGVWGSEHETGAAAKGLGCGLSGVILELNPEP